MKANWVKLKYGYFVALDMSCLSGQGPSRNYSESTQYFEDL